MVSKFRKSFNSALINAIDRALERSISKTARGHDVAHKRTQSLFFSIHFKCRRSQIYYIERNLAYILNPVCGGGRAHERSAAKKLNRGGGHTTVAGSLSVGEWF